MPGKNFSIGQEALRGFRHADQQGVACQHAFHWPDDYQDLGQQDAGLAEALPLSLPG
jgi:hypothetical protein